LKYLFLNSFETAFPKPSANIQSFFLSASGFAKIFLIDFVTFAVSKLQPLCSIKI